MSRLLVYTVPGDILLDTENPVRISSELALVNVGFRHWVANSNLSAIASSEEILSSYKKDIEEVMQAQGFKSVDVVSMNPSITASMDSAKFNAARNKFLFEHIHVDDEVRFFVEGEGLFCLHIEDKVYQILCNRRDFISVPANTKHWFDMGTKPNFKCIRFFSEDSGWVAEYTGDKIAERFPLLDNLMAVTA